MYSNASAWNFKSEANPAYQAAPLFTRTSSRYKTIAYSQTLNTYSSLEPRFLSGDGLYVMEAE